MVTVKEVCRGIKYSVYKTIATQQKNNFFDHLLDRTNIIFACFTTQELTTNTQYTIHTVSFRLQFELKPSFPHFLIFF